MHNLLAQAQAIHAVSLAPFEWFSIAVVLICVGLAALTLWKALRD